jgi:hypothetical protein
MLTRREFAEIMGKVSGAWRKGELDTALSGIETVLEDGIPDMKSESLLERGRIRQSMGATAAARQDWTEGLRYAREGTYLRFLLELSLGEALEREEQLGEALGWYKIALQTCSSGEEFAGLRALTAYLRLNGNNIEPGDHALLASVVVKSWRVLELPGTPNLENLRSATEELTAAFSKRVDEIVRNS